MTQNFSSHTSSCASIRKYLCPAHTTQPRLPRIHHLTALNRSCLQGLGPLCLLAWETKLDSQLITVPETCKSNKYIQVIVEWRRREWLRSYYIGKTGTPWLPRCWIAWEWGCETQTISGFLLSVVHQSYGRRWRPDCKQLTQKYCCLWRIFVL